MKLTNMILCNKGGDFIKRNKIIRRNIQKYIHSFMEKFLKCLSLIIKYPKGHDLSLFSIKVLSLQKFLITFFSA